MHNTIRFYAFCSKTRERFTVDAVIEAATLVFKHAYKTGTGQGGGHATASYEGMNTTAFICPCCSTGANNGSPFGTWTCTTCQEIHCMGTRAGLHHGACGNCHYPTSAFLPLGSGKVKLARAEDF